jgi:hypothetical protein
MQQLWTRGVITETFWTEDRTVRRSGYPTTLLVRLRNRLRQIGNADAIRAAASAFSHTRWPEEMT